MEAGMKIYSWFLLVMFVLSITLVIAPSAEATRGSWVAPLPSQSKKANSSNSSSSKKCDAECQKKLDDLKKLNHRYIFKGRRS